MTTHNVRLTTSPILSARQSFSFPRHSLGNTSNSLANNKIFIIDWPRFTWCNMRPIVFLFLDSSTFGHIQIWAYLMNCIVSLSISFGWLLELVVWQFRYLEFHSIRVNMWRSTFGEVGWSPIDDSWILYFIKEDHKESWCFSIFPELYLQNIKTIVSIRTFHISSADCIVYGKPVTKMLLV